MPEKMSLLGRVGLALTAFAEGKSVSPSISAFLTGADMDDAGGGAQLAHPYAQSAWVYTATSILAQHIASTPFRISRMDGKCAKKIRRRHLRRALGEDIIESGDVVDLFNQPHPTMDRKLFFELLVTWLTLRGECFVLPLDAADQPVDMTDRNPRVRRLLTVEPTMFWHNVTGYNLNGWRYTGSPLQTPLPSQYLLPGEVIHSRTPNPYLYWRGMSPLAVAALAAKTDYAGAQFQKGLWINNADTGVIVRTDQQADDAQQKQILAALNERKRKAGTADRPLFLWGGATVEKPTLSLMDMQFLETRRFLRNEIFSILKVPPSLAGFTEDVNDGGAGGSLDAQKISFVESTLASVCEQIECALQPIVKSFGDDLIGWFDLDSLPIMQAARRTRWDTATKMFGLGVPLNDINANLDLGLPDYAWGATGYLPYSVQPAGAMDALPGESDPNEPEPDADPDDETKSNPFLRMQKFLGGLTALRAENKSEIENKAKPSAAAIWRKRMNFRQQHVKLFTAAIWRKRMNFRQQHVKLFTGKIGKVLMKYRSKALAKLNDAHLQKSAGQMQWEARGLVDIIFDAHDFGAALVTELNAPIRGVLQSGGEMMLSEMGKDDPWKYPSKAMVEYLAGRKQKIAGCGDTLRAQLNTTLVEGVENGEMHDELAARVKEVFGDMADNDARRIARTEVNSAATNGGFEALTDAGVQYKSWLGSHGPHARPEHQAVEDATIGDPIPVDEPFEVDGEQMMFPLDDSLGASAGNIINCQCDVLAAQKTGEDEKSVTFKIFGVGEMKFSKK